MISIVKDDDALTSSFFFPAHDRYPKYETNEPLPDIILDKIPLQTHAFEYSEYCAVALQIIWYTIVLLHRHKWILLRRQVGRPGHVGVTNKGA